MYNEDYKKKTNTSLLSWLNKNYLSIVVLLIPNLIGTFASMFVFLNGLPTIIKALHFSVAVTLNDTVKLVGVLAALAITIYINYTSAHASYKEFKRKAELDKLHAKIIVSEAKCAKYSEQLSMLLNLSKNLLGADTRY